MDLWIRSQDKKNLLKIDNIMIDKKCAYKEETLTNCYSVATYIFDRLYYLGIYKSEKKALGVISKIQKLLEPKIFVSSSEDVENGICLPSNHTECNVMQFNSIVYEMPQEK